MKKYVVNGWNDRGAYEARIIVARTLSEAIQIAKENGLYPDGFRIL